MFDLNGSAGAGLRQATLDHYVPLQGPDFEKWLDGIDGLGARIDPEKIFTFRASP